MFSQASIRKDKRHVLSRLLNQAADCNLAPRKVSAKSGKFLLAESRILGFQIRNSAQGIRNLQNDWNPESKIH